MLKTVDYGDLLENKNKYTFVDVRSCGEYSDATIPNSINIPLFNNEERKEVGTLYKEEGKLVAMRTGVAIVGKKLPSIFEKFFEINETGKKIVVFCARGGMRSTSIASLLVSLGFPMLKLNYGYKGYRNYIRESLPQKVDDFEFVVLYGKTGTGKTYILNELKKNGYNILDLEGCANHRGSLLGGIGLNTQNSQKYFESLVFDSLQNANSNLIFTEGESKRIGNVILPDFLYNKLIYGRKILIKASIPKRILNIKNEYIKDNSNIDEIINAVKSLGKYISCEKINFYINEIRNANFECVIEDLIISYYDKVYGTNKKLFETEFVNEAEFLTAKALIEYFDITNMPPAEI